MPKISFTEKNYDIIITLIIILLFIFCVAVYLLADYYGYYSL